MSETQTLKLTKPIQAHGQTISELTFRELTGDDLMKAGSYPVRFTTEGGNTVRTFDAQAISTLISRLAQVPPSSVGQMRAADWSVAMGIVLAFLADSTPDSSSTDISSSPGYGDPTGSSG